jgi:DNA/RNA-binding domain of Phe-tRNA-synthetase-like protein
MKMIGYLEIHRNLQEKFPGLAAQIIKFKDINIETENNELEEYKKEIQNKIKAKWNIEELREDPIFRAYRDFFWKLGIDPTKIRPAAEALIRRVLKDKPIPKINTWVDTYNIASIETAIPIASFDADLLSGKLFMREANKGEKFLGISMKKPVLLKGGEALIEDGERLVAIYPYRDAEYSKVTLETRNVHMLMCGAPNITLKKLNESSTISQNILNRFCG